MNLTLDEFIRCVLSGLKYLPNTLLLCVVSLFFGIVFGCLIAIIRTLKVKMLSQVFSVFISIYNGIPFIVTMLIYNLLFLLKFDDFAKALGLNARVATVSTISIGYFALSISAICVMSESFRGAFSSIGKEQYEAGYAMGLNVPQTLRRIIVPQVVPVAVPMLLNNFIGLLKGSSVVMTIGIMDVLNGALIPTQISYNFLVGYIAAAGIYWAIAIIVEQISEILKIKLSQHSNTI
jgi:L-cystine transport system permease protein